MSSSKKTLYRPSRKQLDCVGQFSGTVYSKGKTTTQPVYMCVCRQRIEDQPLRATGHNSTEAGHSIRFNHIWRSRDCKLLQKVISLALHWPRNLGKPFGINLKPGVTPNVFIPQDMSLYCFEIGGKNESWREWNEFDSSEKSITQLRGVPEWPWCQRRKKDFNLCWSQTTEWGSLSWNPPKNWRSQGAGLRSNSIQQIECQQQILANTTHKEIPTAHNIPDTIWALSVHKDAFWNLKRTGAFP